jgi:hypothetical protein
MSLVDLASLQRIAGAPPQLSPDGKPSPPAVENRLESGRQIFPAVATGGCWRRAGS